MEFDAVGQQSCSYSCSLISQACWATTAYSAYLLSCRCPGYSYACLQK